MLHRIAELAAVGGGELIPDQPAFDFFAVEAIAEILRSLNHGAGRHAATRDAEFVDQLSRSPAELHPFALIRSGEAEFKISVGGPIKDVEPILEGAVLLPSSSVFSRAAVQCVRAADEPRLVVNGLVSPLRVNLRWARMAFSATGTLISLDPPHQE